MKEYFPVSSDFSDSVALEISIFLMRTDFDKWYHSQLNSEDKKCENLLIFMSTKTIKALSVSPRYCKN